MINHDIHLSRNSHTAGLSCAPKRRAFRTSQHAATCLIAHTTRALQAYLGERNIQHIVSYTEFSPTRFKDFWRS
jgi:hypothetical protein